MNLCVCVCVCVCAHAHTHKQSQQSYLLWKDSSSFCRIAGGAAATVCCNHKQMVRLVPWGRNSARLYSWSKAFTPLCSPAMYASNLGDWHLSRSAINNASTLLLLLFLLFANDAHFIQKEFLISYHERKKQKEKKMDSPAKPLHAIYLTAAETSGVNCSAWAWRQCPLLAPSVHGPQMVWECVCVCVCVYVWTEWTWSTQYIGISTYQFIPYYASAIHAHTHPQTIWGQRTDGAKSGYCQTMYNPSVLPLFPNYFFFSFWRWWWRLFQKRLGEGGCAH